MLAVRRVITAGNGEDSKLIGLVRSKPLGEQNQHDENRTILVVWHRIGSIGTALLWFDHDMATSVLLEA